MTIEPMSNDEFDRRHPEMSDLDYIWALNWWDANGHPPYRRVWNDGVDVTDGDPEAWPDLWKPGFESRSRAYRRHK